MFAAGLAEGSGALVVTPGVNAGLGSGLGLTVGSVTLPPFRGSDSDSDSDTGSDASGTGLSFSSQANHEYRPLKPDEIRLLVLNPGLPDEPIQCFLEYYIVNQAKGYEALSYVWGDTQDSCLIQVDGCPFKVTRNLKDFLASYRTNRTCPVLWIDAICINQKNYPERSAQVRLMKRVYEGADSIVIWLGLDAKGTGSAIEYMKHIYEDVWLRRLDDGRFEERALSAITREGISEIIGKEQEISDDTWPGIHDLLERPWWSRIWVYQEATAPVRRGSTVYCGPHTIAFRKVLVVNKIIQHLAVSGSGFLDFPSQASLTGTFMDVYSQLRRNYHKNGTTDFLRMADLLPALRGFKATDPRDKLYALIPTSLDGADLLDVDYSLSVREVYTNAALSFMRHHRNLDVLGHCTKPEQDSQFELPSWVPDWTSDRAPVHFFKREPRLEFIEREGDEYLKIAETNGKLYNASSGSESEIRVDKTLTKLFCRGFQYDVVDAVGDANNETYQCDQIVEKWRQWLEEISLPLSQVPGSYAHSLGDESTEDALTRILTADCNRKGVDTARRVCSVDSSRRQSVSSRTTGEDIENESQEDIELDREVVIELDREEAIELDREVIIELDREEVTEMDREAIMELDREEVTEIDKVIFELDRDDDIVSNLSGFSAEAGAGITGAHPATFRRRLIVTKKQYLGLASEHVEPGDVVTILMGGQLPIILRRVNNHYILIGEAYIHGIMDGEAMPKDNDIQASSEEFEIW